MCSLAAFSLQCCFISVALILQRVDKLLIKTPDKKNTLELAVEKIRPLAGSREAGRPGSLRENALRARTLRRLKRFS